MEPSDEVGLPRRASVPVPEDTAPVSRRLLASWRRSEEYGVSLESVEPVWAGTDAGDSLFAECGHEVLTGLHRTLADEPLSLMLTDADGLVLNRFSGDTSLLRALDAVHLAPGFAFSEREAGTNGLGLALADRAPSLVRAEEHYSASLCTYTCAAVPVTDPESGRLEGCVNITTWARSSAGLLLALAESAASTTSALMLARMRGRRRRPPPSGGVFRVQHARLEPGSGTLRAMSAPWVRAVEDAQAGVTAGRGVAAVGEPGSGRATVLAQAMRRAFPRSRILSAAAPGPEDVEGWLRLWTPELSKPDTAVVVEGVDLLPAWAADDVADLLHRLTADPRDARDRGPVAWGVTAPSVQALPTPLARLVGTVVDVPALRERPDDVLPLARHTARQTRMVEVEFTPAAVHALERHDWPGNVDELVRAVHLAATRTSTVDLQHLPAHVLGGPSTRLSRIEALERDEIARTLATPGMTATRAAVELGVSRSTLYRKIDHYGLQELRASGASRAH